MLIIRIKTRNLLRVTRKYESRSARLLAITSTGEGPDFDILYAMDEYWER